MTPLPAGWTIAAVLAANVLAMGCENAHHGDGRE